MPIEASLHQPQNLFTKQVRYEVPNFQRKYVWTQEDQWESLWDDVEEVAQSIMEDSSAKPHFMGAIVLQQTPFPAGTIERRIVVDGQQRLTTLQILIDAIQEVLEKRGYVDPAERLKVLVVNNNAYLGGNQDNAFKIWPTVTDRDAFRHAMSNDLSDAMHLESPIVKAHNFFKRQAKQWLDRLSEQTGSRDSAAAALEEAVRTKLELVVINLGDTDDPNVIFETLNARGTPLLQSDMVKNKILHDDGKWPFADDWWSDQVGRGVQQRPRIDVYLNHWLTLCSRVKIKAYDEFRVFERYVYKRQDEGDTIHDITRNMKKVGDIYRKVEKVHLTDIETEIETDVESFLERRNIMNVGAITPLLLWLLSEDIPPKTLKTCLKALESFLVRRVICGYSTRRYGEFFVELIAKLNSSPANETSRVLVAYLAEQTTQATVWPSDSDLRERFITAPLYLWLTRGRLRMVLTGIEEQLRTGRSETQKVPNKLQIEHIMPQSWCNNNWPITNTDDETMERRNRMIHTIGNLTLVNGPLNIALSNAPWKEKKDALSEHSVLFLNKHLVNDGPLVWDEAAIEERSRQLYEKVAKMWPRGTAEET